ncbi:guanine nucleotide exchange factor for Rab-3A-like [Adelges cooleyi]|uniref:guanine nucleotide exchange factor for Rab-3A-like n=1 Tax=Adelges cooleyi TaxID=133065 RepID=UPI00218010F1|nr:guanine nucleotide exchange factor for Rab-3A-like [Adelges cooleyi]XP_050429680.1 guanine nucleotide exchange factor for Rab-3A-like [Adelges cooleyi]XP_050429681.1 guanine nucleotide exchange factor for Rab-3A-like [Adelges cooleyi]XP_050429682.1 guanine nucleotide exchange factor for Rab-3A-like [Adelges cooleyi]XP_050429683.1 guanine nucleotide exchange factor for Rab-3A-like [Adelges cooleyi]XP_050429684.1 guanine nucleotide exchange factor for Rab-3A-like [Adelges cooleyi]
MNTLSETDIIDESPNVPKNTQMANDNELILSPKKHLVCFATVRGDCIVSKNGASYAGIKECLFSERMVENKEEPTINQTIESPVPDSDIDSGMESSASSWDRSVNEVKEHAFARLEEELRKANETLKLRDEEVSRLNRIRSDVESELQELTASLFQEAHSMVKEANLRQAAATRALKESSMKVDVLSAEVAALKTLVLTSTPSHPNLSREDSVSLPGGLSGVGLFYRKHKRSPSHNSLKYGRENSPPDSPLKQKPNQSATDSENSNTVECGEVDPNVHREFVLWMKSPTLDKSDAFISRIYREDIDQCLEFNNSTLAMDVRQAIETGNLFIESMDKSKAHFPKKCALMELPLQCLYRMNLGGANGDWYCISKICRNKITAVCDFLNYLKYIQRGLVKSPENDMYWEIIKLRKQMMMAKLGLAL